MSAEQTVTEPTYSEAFVDFAFALGMAMGRYFGETAKPPRIPWLDAIGVAVVFLCLATVARAARRAFFARFPADA